MKLKATVYRLAFSTARAAVIRKDHEYPLRHDPQGRPALSGLGGGGVGPSPLCRPRRGKPAARGTPKARHAARIRRGRVS